VEARWWIRNRIRISSGFIASPANDLTTAKKYAVLADEATQFLRTVLVSVSDPVLSMHGTGWRIWRWYRSGQGQFVFELDDVQNANLPTSITSPLVEQARTSAVSTPPCGL
jgi:hypothetical protein